MQFIPNDATRMECLVIYETLQRIKHTTLSGTPSGKAIDAAIQQAITQAQNHRQTLDGPAQPSPI